MRPSTFSGPGGRREITVVCPECQFQSTVPPAAVMRNAYFCSRCGKPMDLQAQLLRPGPGPGAAPGAPGGGFAGGPRRDRGSSKYKSSRKGRR
ncbi:MAG TPA: hypothetical protein VM490_15320 [Armatimonadaceae bacterium]|nr:hypothetical protein [Armatimonadaceae bacterium]